MSALLILKAIGIIAGLGGGTWLATKLANKIPRVNLHTKYELFNHVANAVGNAAEDVLKSVLTSGDIDALLTAAAAGTPIGAALAALMPTLMVQVESAAGPAAKETLSSLLGGDQAAADHIQTAITSAAHDIWTAHKAASAGATPQPGQVVSLADGHLLVVPHGQSLPEGSKLVASLPKAA